MGLFSPSKIDTSIKKIGLLIEKKKKVRLTANLLIEEQAVVMFRQEAETEKQASFLCSECSGHFIKIIGIIQLNLNINLPCCCNETNYTLEGLCFRSLEDRSFRCG